MKPVSVVWDGTPYVCTPAPEPEPEQGRVIVYSQRDPRWGTLRMGGTPQTVGAMGCAAICACMILSQARPTVTPLEFVQKLNAEGGFNVYGSEAHLAWDRLPGIYHALEWRDRQTWKRLLYPSEIQDLFDIIDREPLILWVDFRPETGPLDTHFVLALGHTDEDIEAADPWTGDRCWLLDRYGHGDDTLADAVWGYRWLRAPGRG